MEYDWLDEGIREIADNIWHAQMAGWPRVLTYVHRPVRAKRAIRRLSLRQIPQILSRDEYPFASTLENDGSVWIGHASVAQQNAQRDLINAFYRRHGAYRKGTVLTFEVRVLNHPLERTTLTPHPSHPAIRYRRAELADVPRVALLPREGEAGGDPPERMARYLAGEHHPQQALPPRAMWIALDGDSPVGYVAGHLTRRFGCEGELQWIYVVPAHRRSRVGAALVHLLAEWFIAQQARTVCVNVGDEAARPFYRHCGAVDLRPHWMAWDDIGRALAPLSSAEGGGSPHG